MDNIRTEIDEIDTKAGTLIENLEEEFTSCPELPHIQDLMDILNELQNVITAYQEAEGWI